MTTEALKRSRLVPGLKTLADLRDALGEIPLERIWLRPAPGTATEKDVVAALDGPNKCLCELVDGVLVEKPMGTKEALLAGVIVHYWWTYVGKKKLGVPVPADGAFRLKWGLVRLPDVSFVSWSRLPAGEFPEDAIAPVVPDLAVEVFSRRNTRKEIERKLEEYFQAGVRMVWVIYPKTKTASIYSSPSDCRPVGEDGVSKREASCRDSSFPFGNFSTAQKNVPESPRQGHSSCNERTPR